MRQRGYTIVELLVSMGMLAVVLGLVVTGVQPQVRQAGAITRSARMQSEARAAFDLISRDLRMAGYGIDLTMPGVPAPMIQTSDLTMWGNYTNIRTTGGGSGSVVTVASGTGFAPNNYLVITNALFGGEARLIAGVSSNTVVLAQPLSRAYAAGSAVQQLEPIRYALSNYNQTRNGQVALTGVSSSTVQYYLQDGSLVTTPPAAQANIRTALVSLTTIPTDQPAGVSDGDDLNVSAEVRVRNLGLVSVIPANP